MRGTVSKLQAPEPFAVTGAPVLADPVVGDVVPQKQLAHAVAGAHQITADVLAGSDEVPQRLLLPGGNPDRVQTVDHQQPHESLRVTTVGLHPILRWTLDLPRCRDHAVDSCTLERPGERETRRTRLVGDPRRAGQPSAELHHRTRSARQPPRAQLTRLAVDRHRQHLRRVHIQPSPTANLCHGRHLHDCGRRPGHSWTLNPRTSCAGADPHTNTGRRPAVHRV